ncbi:hypothetical protein MUCCIDRAFT_115736 [Mucor lusitanicus CBS 277.49]|uniref:Uncharacterized protein n=1 Tax=Mucor lusitanicus CBS 277.49 TaxID=747725 RepID=A0A168GZW5_MUCCL|nr:hypothetical protein MUCCIDRAFT_115736 [Mucor lusitanicus CBS 277.49]
MSTQDKTRFTTLPSLCELKGKNQISIIEKHRDCYLILRIGQQKSQTDADVGLLETDAAVPEVDAGLPETDVGVPETLVGESETDADYLPSKLKITDTIYKTVDNNSRCDIL